jgi:high-affinity iron transporter
MAAAVLSFREGLDAVLIIGIVLTLINRVGQRQRSTFVWAGVLLAAGVSVTAAAGLLAIGTKLEGTAEQLFEGSTMLLAASILTWMIFWLRERRNISRELEGGVRTALDRGGNWALFWLAFASVLREGLELALFLAAAVFASSVLQALAGALAGIVLAIATGLVLFLGIRRLDLKRFFTVTSILLIVFAAGLVGRGVGELQEAGVLPSLVDSLWSTKAILSDSSSLGAVLNALVGYVDSPSLMQVTAYIAYVVIVIAAMLRLRSRPDVRRAAGPVV